ncbi:indoleacetic acid-induced protein 15 [Arabidopsis lyrata subsp. lyrata]|uniref:Auxin-responsive protein n=1 Tax=Arabidopsis lyrata subsp. lyrata TaxID=81972 RepID=D7KX63_ARALL|nr:indoleacetic acid-induced protein 15 [Arabidopsis lyrata subsp. lyrata]
MSSEEYVRVWPDSGDLGGIELTLALPGTPTNASDGPKKCRNKRRFLETVDLKLGEGHENKYFSSLITNDQLVGWPPVTTARKTVRRKYVKVAVDGAAYLRKVDLEMYDCYGQLFTALENMFQGIITICKVTELERKGEFVATYEDKDGDWMLVGDVPWMMFVESCKRMRLMKIGDAIGL